MLKSMTPRFQKKSSGMTLLEVLVAMLLIGSALGMSLSMIQSSLEFERSALRFSAFLDATDELASLSRSNKLCASSYAFNGFTLDSNGRAVPKFTNSACTPADDKFKNDTLIKASHKLAQADITNWLTDLIQHFPQSSEQRSQTIVTYENNTLKIAIPYLKTEATESAVNTALENFKLNYTVQL